MLQLVRAIYPQACLISELVSADEGNYLIRALVQVDGIIIANAFGLSNDLEAAQDLALTRLFKILGIEVVSADVGLSDRVGNKNDIARSVPVATIAPKLPDIEPNSSYSPPPINLEKAKIESPVSNMATHKPSANLPSVPPTRNIEPNSSYSPPRIDLETANIESPSNMAANKPSANPPSLPSARHYELINLTDVEIRRLGWTKNQGRDYLNLKYGQKVRSDLTEAQLEDFWRYLQSL